MDTRSTIAIAAELYAVLKEKQQEAVNLLLLLLHVLYSLAHTGVDAGHKLVAKELTAGITQFRDVYVQLLSGICSSHSI